jgi:outer membrane biosynthesis protein TonB
MTFRFDHQKTIADHIGLILSLALHLAILLMMVFGFFPIFKPDIPQETSISVELLPITSESNVKPKQQTNKTDKKEPAEAKKIVKAAAPEPVKEKPREEEKKKEAEPIKKDEAEKIKPKEKKEEEKKAKEQPKEQPKDKPKEQPKKKPQKTSELDSLLKTLEEVSDVKTENAKETKKQVEAHEEDNEKSKGTYDPTKALSLSEEDAIRSQIAKCWSVPAGAREASDMAVLLHISLERDGTVKSVKIVDNNRYNSGNQDFYRAAADSAVRAVKKCSPLKNLPTNKYNNWKELELNFDPRDML